MCVCVVHIIALSGLGSCAIKSVRGGFPPLLLLLRPQGTEVVGIVPVCVNVYIVYRFFVVCVCVRADRGLE